VLTNWEDLVAPIADVDKTPERFEQTLQAMYRKCVGAEARDIEFEYFRTLQKSLKSSTLDHSIRMFTDEQIKKCIFQYFPLTWQQQFWTISCNHAIVGYCGVYEQQNIIR
jgi:hypothetical protein